jgi:hypothetical protein
MHVRLDFWWILTIPNYSLNVNSGVFNVEEASWDMMPSRVVSRCWDTENGTSRPAEMSATLPLDMVSYASML